jgi:2-keto-4-pentenoate hydratase/2-oxohepta-3-ene-1,7-dioic acid hydratase in catechol pathway
VKLLAFARGAPGESDRRLGLVTDAGIRDLTATTGARDVGELVASGEDLAGLEARAARESLDVDTVSVLAPIAAPGKIICVGLNYHDHCREQAIDPPAYPILFAKFATAIAAPGEPVVRPRATEKLDLEVELAAVIGRSVHRASRDEALAAVFGYTVLNDVTMRDLQREDHQWLRAKGSDGFAPIGPVVVTTDEIADPRRLRLRSSVNGETWQDSTTAEMVFDVATIVAFVSRTLTLHPGDIIATGTPAGVGHFADPPRYLRGGDRMRCEIDGIGALDNPIVDEQPRADDHARAAGLAELLEPVEAG